MLELRPNCELCDKDLPPDAADARICTYECNDAPGNRRRHTPYSREQIETFAETLRAVHPSER
jgi:hypothetical protein